MDKEIWKPIKGYEGIYQVSNLGRVAKYLNNGDKKIINGSLFEGYKTIGLHKNGKCKKYLMHRLVAITFIPNPNNLPLVNHIDENKLNNRVDNLEWCDYKYNNNYGTCKERAVETRREKYRLIEDKIFSIPSGIYKYSTLARMMDCSYEYIKQMVNKNKLKGISIDGIKFVKIR